MQKSGFSTESRSRGYKSGGGLGESKCMGCRLQRPLGNCREGEWAEKKQCSPRRLTEQRQSKGLVIWTFHLGILLGKNPLYLALGTMARNTGVLNSKPLQRQGTKDNTPMLSFLLYGSQTLRPTSPQDLSRCRCSHVGSLSSTEGRVCTFWQSERVNPRRLRAGRKLILELLFLHMNSSFENVNVFSTG